MLYELIIVHLMVCVHRCVSGCRDLIGQTLLLASLLQVFTSGQHGGSFGNFLLNYQNA